MSTNTPTVPWTLDAGAPGEMRIDNVAADGDAGHRQLGESASYTLVLQNRHNQPADVDERYHQLLDRGRYADQFTLKPIQGGRPGYVAEWPGATDIDPLNGGTDENGEDADSLLVSLEPTQPLQSSTPGLWGLIEAVAPDVHPVVPEGGRRNYARVEMEIVRLADIGEYDTREELRDDLEYPGLL